MKRLISVLLFLLCFNSYAQKIKIGFRSGASFSNFYDHNASGNTFTSGAFSGLPNSPSPILPTVPSSNSYYRTNFFKDQRIGFYSGFFVDWELNKKWNLELGLNYSQKGINVKYKLNSDTLHADNSHTNVAYQFNRNLRLDYITIPIVIKYKLDRKERFYVLGGVYNAFAIGFKLKNTTSILSQKDISASGGLMQESLGESQSNKAYAHIFDSGLIGGFGVQWPLKNKWSVGLELRGSLGLINVPARYDETGFVSFGPNTKNISFETGLKLQYSLK